MNNESKYMNENEYSNNPINSKRIITNEQLYCNEIKCENEFNHSLCCNCSHSLSTLSHSNMINSSITTSTSLTYMNSSKRSFNISCLLE